MVGIVAGGAPLSVVSLVQEGLVEKAFSDGLMPNIAFRVEAMAEEWPEGTGQEIWQTRQGLLKPVTRPLQPGADPVPQKPIYEQWVARLSPYGDTADVDIPTSKVSSINTFIATINAMGVNAGRSVNLISRNEMFRAYLGGWTAAMAAATTGGTALVVASLNGFTDIMRPGIDLRPLPVSTSNPLPIRIGAVGTGQLNTVVGVQALNAADPLGPGTLILGSALSANVAARTAIVSKYAPRIVRSGGGDSVDAIGSGDTLVIQDIINSAALLKNANVPRHDDGLYHAHISALSEAQFYSDPIFQKLNQSLPDGPAYRDGYVGQLAGVAFYVNQESPNAYNTGDRVLTGTNAFYSTDIQAETTNDAGIDIGRILITGKGGLYERRLKEDYMTDAGYPGQVGEFDAENNGNKVNTDGIRMVLRGPIDRQAKLVAVTWTITTSFPIPSDALAPSGPERFKRMIVLEHAL